MATAIAEPKLMPVDFVIDILVPYLIYTHDIKCVLEFFGRGISDDYGLFKVVKYRVHI